MAQRRYLFLGLVAVLALAVSATFAVRELTVTSAETSTGQMRLTVTAGGSCEAQKCQVDPGAVFTLTVVATTANADMHIGFQTQVNYDALVQHGGSYTPTAQANAEVVIATCSYPGIPVRANNTTTHIVGHGATAGFPGGFVPCSSAGNLISLSMTCSPSPSSNELLLVPYSEPGNTTGTAWKSAAEGNPNVIAKTTNVTVNCGTPEPPTNTVPPATDTPTPEPGTPTETPTAGPTATPSNTPTAGPPTHTPTTAPPTPTRTNTPPVTENCAQVGHGDSNGDGIINSVDSLWVLWDVAAISDALKCPLNADANKDGNITSVDSTLILQFIADLIDDLPPS